MSGRSLGWLVLALGFAYVGWTELADNDTVEALAAETACQGRECDADVVKKKRELFGWKFEVRAYGVSSNRFVEVWCSRPLWLIGGYRCRVEGQTGYVDERFR